MNEEEYLEKRVENQIKWYDKKSLFNQRQYKLFSKLQIILSASIPILVYLNDMGSMDIFISVVGASITIATSVMSICKYFENWINYRTATENLKNEKYSFLTKTGVYFKEDRFNVFVQNVENLISTEHSTWKINIKKQGKV